MKLQYSIAQHCIDKETWDKIAQKYKSYKIPYFKEQDEEVNSFQHYYMTKDCFLIHQDSFFELLTKMDILNNDIIPKTVKYLLENDKEKLVSYFKFTPRMVEVMEYDYKNNKQLNSYYWRYDLLIDKDNQIKVIEFNSETPAWFGETLLSTNCIYNELLDNQLSWTVDFNSMFEERVWKSFQDILQTIKAWETLGILYWASGNEVNTYEEDYINALHLCAFFLRKWINAKMIFANELSINNDGLFHWDEKIHHIFTFYPLEWIFEDDVDGKFFDGYLSWKFTIINNVLNLISQNKMFWAYLYEYMLYNNTLSFEEKSIIQDLLPKSSSWDFFWAIKKAILFREWIGIDNDKYEWEKVYQQRINQQEFDLNTFYSNKDFRNSYEKDESWKQHWYITLWIYYWRNSALGIYTRFSEHFVSDDSCYFLPVFIKKNSL